MEPRITMVTLGVSDLKRAIHFYRDGLKFPLSSSSNHSVAFFRTGGVVLALFPRDALAADATVAPGGGGFRGFTLAHNVRSSAEVESVLSEVASAGARIVKSARKAQWGGYSGYFADPDENLWEVAFNPFAVLNADGSINLLP